MIPKVSTCKFINHIHYELQMSPNVAYYVLFDILISKYKKLFLQFSILKFFLIFHKNTAKMQIGNIKALSTIM